MDPPASPSVSPDPSPQEHSSPSAPSLAKRSPWKATHTPNGVFEPGIMDDSHWPALSETAKATAKPSDSSRPPESATASVAPSAVANSSTSSQKHHGRQKPARRGGAAGGDHSPRDHPDRGAPGWDHGGGRGGQRNHNNGGGRRGNGGGGFGGRRRGGYDGFYRGPPPMGMGPYMRAAPPPPPSMAVPTQFMPPPPPPVSPMRPFAGPMVFHELPSPVSPVPPMYYFGPPPPPEALRGMAFAPSMVGPPAYPYFQAPHEQQPDSEADPQENHAKLLKQIEFYFSKDNLCTDVFLRRKMDEQGWVDISLIASFKKVRELTMDLQYIKETVQSSHILETQDDKIRRRNDWDKWVIPRESNPDIASSSEFATSQPTVKDLTVHLGGMSLHESASPSGMVDKNHHKAIQNGSPSGDDQVPVIEDNSGDH